jgi:predicted RNase H-related nuclease YkuK (DUF458 family)
VNSPGKRDPTWRTIKGERIASLHDFVRQATCDGDRKLEIGTDSLQRTRNTQFVTVVAILNPGRGGRAIYRREVVPRIRSLRERLLREVWLSVGLGLELNDIIPATNELTIHIDANPVVTHRSSRYIQELVGMVVSQGFQAEVKPDAWVATHAADYVVRSLARPGAQPPHPLPGDS